MRCTPSIIAGLMENSRSVHEFAHWHRGIIIALPCNRLCNLRHYELSLTPSSDRPRADSVAVGPCKTLRTARVTSTWSRQSLGPLENGKDKIRIPFFSPDINKNRSLGNLSIRRGIIANCAHSTWLITLY